MDKQKSTTTGSAIIIGGQKSKPTPSAPMGDTVMNTPATGRRIIQNFRLIWLDANIDESNDDFRHSITQLRRNVNTINTFIDADQCVDCLTDIKDEKAFMIVSGALCQHIIPLIHDVSQLNSIFVFCGNKASHEQWVKKWPKVKGVFTEIGPLCDALKRAARHCDQDTISISFVTAEEASTVNLDQLDQSFMYTQILKEMLFEIVYNEQSKQDLCAYCSDKYAENASDLDIIADFGRSYRHKSPIWWYTHRCFLYSMLNRALRTQEVDTLIKMGFFIRDLHQHIKDLHSQQFRDQQAPFTVYRGQGLSNEDFEKLIKTKGGLMSFNNFLSTSRDKNVSVAYAESNGGHHSESIGILFEITIDPSISSTPFALTDEVSYYQDSEQEILFSMHTVFRMGEVKKLNESNRLWQVELRLTSDNDPLLSALTDRMREETRGSSGWNRLGNLLIKLGEFDKAEQVYRVLLEQKRSDDDSGRGYLYNQLGYIKRGKGDYVAAISFHEKALEIYKKTLPPNHPSLAASYNNIGSTYYEMGEYSKALSFYEKALETKQKTFPPNHPDLATFYSNIGLVYDSMGGYSKALPYHEKALEIRRNSLPANHPSLASSYNNIGLVYDSMGEYSKALLYHEKALEIFEKTLPPNHPSLATSYNNIGLVYKKMGEYSKALSFYEKALEIKQKTLPPNHPDFASSYNNIGLVYVSMGGYSKALPYHEKALEIRRNSLPANHPDLATSYNNIGLVYDNMGEYSKALSFYEKALEIRRKSLPPNHPDLATSYNNIGNVYHSMGEYSKALSFYEKALEIRRKSLPPNHPSLATSYNNIGSTYDNMGEYSKALSSHEKALEIRRNSLPPNHRDLAQSYNNIGSVYDGMGKYSKALLFYDKSLEIRQKTLLPNHPSLATSYNNIGNVYHSMGEYSKALSFYEKALEISRKSLPPNHPDLASFYNNIGLVYSKMGEYSKALSFFERALEIWHRSLPANHPNIQTCKRSLELVRKKLQIIDLINGCVTK